MLTLAIPNTNANPNTTLNLHDDSAGLVVRSNSGYSRSYLYWMVIKIHLAITLY